MKALIIWEFASHLKLWLLIVCGLILPSISLNKFDPAIWIVLVQFFITMSLSFFSGVYKLRIIKIFNHTQRYFLYLLWNIRAATFWAITHIFIFLQFSNNLRDPTMCCRGYIHFVPLKLIKDFNQHLCLNFTKQGSQFLWM